MLRLTARAKINWTLDIVGKRADGYHSMDMLMTSVELADTLWMERAETLSLRIAEGSAKAALVLGDESNLVWKAAQALRQATGCEKGAAVRLEKRIPVGAGMGGGSADAAAALIGLCRLWELAVSPEKLLEIGLSIGADVPFLLTGGLARVRGIGESIERLPFPAPHWLVLTQPCEGLSTPEIFRAFDAFPAGRVLPPQTEKAEQALMAGDVYALAEAMGNVMEPISLIKRPEIGIAIKELEGLGALRAMMTGSGSVVYGVFEKEAGARAACECLRGRWEKTYVTKTAEKSLDCEALEK